MLEVDRFLGQHSTLPVSKALKPYVKNLVHAEKHLTPQMMAEMVLALEEVTNAKKPKCDEVAHKLVYRLYESARPLESHSPLRRFIDFQSSIYVDLCLSVHLKSISRMWMNLRNVSYLIRMLQNLIEETSDIKATDLNPEQLFNVLINHQSFPKEPLEPIARAIYTTLVELGGDETKQLLSQADAQVTRDIMQERLVEPCYRMSINLLTPTAMVKEDLAMSPRPLVNVDERSFNMLDIGLSCYDFWVAQHDNMSRLVSHIRVLAS